MLFEGPKRFKFESVKSGLWKMLQHLLPILLEPLLGLPSCMWFHIVMEHDHAISFEFALVCCPSHAESESHFWPLYLSNSPVLLPFWFIWNVHMCRPSMLFSLFKQVLVSPQQLPVKHFHLWTFTVCCACFYLTFGTTLILGRNSRNYVEIYPTVWRILLWGKRKEMWRIDLVSSFVLVAHFPSACLLSSSHLREFRERKLIQDNWWCQVILGCISDLFVDTQSKMSEMFAFHDIVY
jgi:hypothetical protein